MCEKITILVSSEIMDLVADFFKEWKADIGPIREALEKANYEFIRKWGHNLKGVGGTCGSDVLSKMGSCLETAAKDENPEMTAETIDSIASYLNCAKLVAE